MIFGETPIDDADGAVLAHAIRTGGLRLRKGERLTGKDIAALRASGQKTIVAARLEAADIGEDEAAAILGEAFSADGVHVGAAATGRVNIYAECAGLFRVEKSVIDAMNAIDPAITIATLADYASVREGQMVATIKIIPLAVSKFTVERARAVLSTPEAVSLSPFRQWNVTLVQTELPATPAKLLDKTRRVTDARLAVSGSRIVREHRVAHRTSELAEVLRAGDDSDLVLVFGASAVIDRRDVIPSAIEESGGRIDAFGMPVDPGNLLLLAELNGRPVIGAPGCARSPKENGFDWILDRLLADEERSERAMRTMGVGGLLAEIETRPRPREAR